MKTVSRLTAAAKAGESIKSVAGTTQLRVRDHRDPVRGEVGEEGGERLF